MDFLSNGLKGFCEALNKVDIQVLFCERFDEKSDIWNFKRHKHDCIELLYFLHGNVEVITGENSVHADTYDIVIYPKGMYHTEFLKYNHHHEIFCVWADIPGLDIPGALRIQDKDASLRGLLGNLHAEYHSKVPCVPLIEHYVKSAAMLVAKKYMTEGPPSDTDIVSRVTLYMRDHMYEQITIQQLADMAYVSKSYLSRLFKRQKGVSIIEYLRALRVETAMTILASSDMSAEEVSRTVGYSSSKYFYHAFRACTGMSPRDFRKQKGNCGSKELLTKQAES